MEVQRRPVPMVRYAVGSGNREQAHAPNISDIYIKQKWRTYSDGLTQVKVVYFAGGKDVVSTWDVCLSDWDFGIRILRY